MYLVEEAKEKLNYSLESSSPIAKSILGSLPNNSSLFPKSTSPVTCLCLDSFRIEFVFCDGVELRKEKKKARKEKLSHAPPISTAPPTTNSSNRDGTKITSDTEIILTEDEAMLVALAVSEYEMSGSPADTNTSLQSALQLVLDLRKSNDSNLAPSSGTRLISDLESKSTPPVTELSQQEELDYQYARQLSQEFNQSSVLSSSTTISTSSGSSSSRRQYPSHSLQHFRQSDSRVRPPPSSSSSQRAARIPQQQQQQQQQQPHLNVDIDQLSYDQLYELQENVWGARQDRASKRGLSRQQIDSLPVFVCTPGSRWCASSSSSHESDDSDDSDDDSASLSSEDQPSQIAPQKKKHNNNNKKTEHKEECAICQGEFEANEILRSLPCLHVFHAYGCLDVWLVSDGRCPVCLHAVF